MPVEVQVLSSALIPQGLVAIAASPFFVTIPHPCLIECLRRQTSGTDLPAIQGDVDRRPFRTIAEVEAILARGGLDESEAGALWDCLYLTPVEIAGLLQVVRERAEADFAPLLHAIPAYTGMRRGEVLRLRWADVEFDQGYVVARSRKQSRRAAETARRVDLHPELGRELLAWRGRRLGGQVEVGEAISPAANQLVLRDAGRPERWASPGKPPGSIHGDSIGVHARDAVNAWRNMARVTNPRNADACLILAVYEVARDRQARAAEFLRWSPRPLAEFAKAVRPTDPKALLAEAEAAIRANQQEIASTLIHRYGTLGHEPAPAFALMLRYAVSEDGALHGEKYNNTVREEFGSTRPAFRWRQLVALARVTASECGRPAPGIAQARELLKV